MTKSEMFVIARISENGTEYMGINANGEFAAEKNPVDLKKCFSKKDADKIKAAMKEAGLPEGVKVRMKAVTQCVRDYCGWLVSQVESEMTVASDKTARKVRRSFEDEEEVEAPAEEKAE